jgi:hypothetical protein
MLCRQKAAREKKKLERLEEKKTNPGKKAPPKKKVAPKKEATKKPPAAKKITQKKASQRAKIIKETLEILEIPESLRSSPGKKRKIENLDHAEDADSKQEPIVGPGVKKKKANSTA